MQTRRSFLKTTAGVALVAPTLIGLGSQSAFAAPTPVDVGDAKLFDFDGLGNARSSLSMVESLDLSPEFTLAANVKTRSGEAVSDALVYVWHTDKNGAYDPAKQNFHGIAITDGLGRFDLTSIVSEGYKSEGQGQLRRAHLHLAVMAPGKAPVQTELFFDFASHKRVADVDFDPRLELTMRHQHQSHALAEFNIVL